MERCYSEEEDEEEKADSLRRTRGRDVIPKKKTKEYESIEQEKDEFDK